MTDAPSERNAPSNVVPLRLHPPGDACLLDIIERARRAGAHLVSNGREIYVTPVVMPGEFPVAVLVKAAA